ncbi:caspase-3-like [Choristoneura fumiferana]|uniref:caspase-3-like n=1 Tax=Choristoneura fumiferana TaxID=7141 RepID=UPI003D15E41F
MAEKDSSASKMAENSSTDRRPATSADAELLRQPTYPHDDQPLPPLRPLQPLPFDPLTRVYDMTGDKIMLIFGHSEYLETFSYRKYENGRPQSRNYTDRDVRRLEEVFSNELGFLIDPHQDLTYDDIHETVKKLSKRDHRNTSCVCVVILTHGNTNGELLAADQPYELESLVALLQKGNEWLVGKPKLFIVQACRGGDVDKGQLQFDGSGDYSFVSTHADTLVLRSSVEGFLSWRDEDGSWLIQELCRVVHATQRQLDFLQMTTMVTSLVVYDRASSTDDPEYDNTKQTPEVRSTLTKLLRFTAFVPHSGAVQ